MNLESEIRDAEDFAEKVERMFNCRIGCRLKGITKENIHVLDFKGKDAFKEGDILNGMNYKLIAAFGYVSMGNYNEAAYQFGHVCQSLRALENIDLAIDAKTIEIKCYRKAGNNEIAEREEIFLKQLKNKNSNQSKQILSNLITLEERGDKYYSLKNFNEAMKYYGQAIKKAGDDDFDRIAQKINDVQRSINQERNFSQRLKV